MSAVTTKKREATQCAASRLLYPSVWKIPKAWKCQSRMVAMRRSEVVMSPLSWMEPIFSSVSES